MTLTFGFPGAKVERTNLLETPRDTYAVTDNTVTFDLKPFEIVTLKLTPA